MKHITKIINQIFFWLALLSTIYVNDMTSDKKIFYAGCIVALAVSAYLMREKLWHLWIFLAGHVLLGGISWLLLDVMGGDRAFCLGLWLLLFGSVVLRLIPNGEKQEAPGFLYLAVLAVCYIVNNLIADRNDGIRQLSLAAFLVALLCKLLYDNLRGADEFIKKRASSTQIDEQKLTQINSVISVIYVAAVGVILALVTQLRTGGISKALFNGIGNILRWIFGRFQTEEQVQQEVQAVTEAAMPDVGTMTEKAPVWAILDHIIEGVVIVAVIAGVVAAVVALLVTLRRHFYGRHRVTDEVEEYTELLTMRGKLAGKDRKNGPGWFDRTPSKRIRRTYYKGMKKLNRSGGLENLSPKEQVRLLAKEQGLTEKEQEEIIGLYEKARYSTESMTEEEARQIKELFRGRSRKSQI